MLKLKAEPRESGKPRVAGTIPAVMYGPKNPTTSIILDEPAFNKVWKEAGESSIVSLETSEGLIDTLIHDIARNPVTDAITHVDFYVVDKNTKVEISVPLEFIGTAPATKEFGAILIKALHEVEVEALPKDLPHGLEVDISSLTTLESQIKAGDISLPAGVTLKTDADEVVALVDMPKEETEDSSGPIDMDAIGISEKKGKKEEEVIDAE